MQGRDGYGILTVAGIATGSDGKIWIGDQNGGKVVRIDPGSMDKEAAVGEIAVTGFSIRNLGPGPDGNMWVTDFGAGQVARVAPTPPDGDATVFDVAGNTVWDIVAGPDGNLWYVSADAARVGRITTAGAFTDFPATAGGDLFGITVGPDGALWVAQAVANSIGRMTADGQFTEVTGLTAVRSAGVRFPGTREHALVHGEGRQPDRPHHRDRRHEDNASASAARHHGA